MNQLLIGFSIALLIAFAAYKLKTLSFSGLIAATIVGTVVFGMGGLNWAILLMIFFITSSVLTKAFKKRKLNLNEKFSKGGRRDYGQVFGNGGLATGFVLLHYFYPQSSFFWFAFVTSMAAVNADTWATEIGVLNPRPPRLITHPLQVVEKGTSGGISLFGSLGSLFGSAIIALLGVLLSPYSISNTVQAFTILTMAGFMGSVFDSFLGATVQAIYFCPTCKKDTERHPLHTCGDATHIIRGWDWLNNDLVNFGCSLISVAFVVLIS